MKQVLVEKESHVIDELVDEIERAFKRSQRESSIFRVGLSGGSLLNYLNISIPRLTERIDLSKWKLYFCDERYVDENDPESTFGCYKKELIPNTSLKLEQFVPIDMSLPLEECARDYEKKIRADFELPNEAEIPCFDLLLLGMGPDGHTCSLFPDHSLLLEDKLLIAPISDSPKPPPQRVTMTLRLINKAKCCIFTICGEGKADIAKRVFKDDEKLPAGMVQPENGEVIVIYDGGAGKYILD